MKQLSNRQKDNPTYERNDLFCLCCEMNVHSDALHLVLLNPLTNCIFWQCQLCCSGKYEMERPEWVMIDWRGVALRVILGATQCVPYYCRVSFSKIFSIYIIFSPSMERVKCIYNFHGCLFYISRHQRSFEKSFWQLLVWKATKRKTDIFASLIEFSWSFSRAAPVNVSGMRQLFYTCVSMPHPGLFKQKKARI